MSIFFKRAVCTGLCSLALPLLLTTTALPAFAGEPAKAMASAKRPRICLVLSGGGARGAAHIGVLKALEEMRIPVDCIAGTSMGSLVGSAYATGTSVTEMEGIVKSITTELLFKEKPPREELSIRRKSDDYTLLFSPEMGLNRGELQLAKGLVTGVQLETVLRQLAKAKGYYHFDDLPIPFRAVATDLVTGEAVIFSDGELANVMRASMSVPGAVAPAEFGGRMLVDGMLTSNLPVETARAMGADIVIAVNVGTPLLKREQLNGIAGVAAQMLSILTEQNVQASLASLKDTDILITPDLGDFSTSDFDHLPKITPLGEAAVHKLAERLAPLALPASEYAALRQRQQIAAVPDVLPVDEVRFTALKRVNPETAQAAMETRAGQPINQKTLDGDMRRLYGTGDFEHVNYSFLEEPGRRVLAVDAVEKTWGPDYLRFGLGLSNDFKGDAFFNLLVSYRQTWLNALGAEWRNDLQIGRTSSLRTEFYQPLNSTATFFVAPHAGIERRAINVFQGSSRVATYDVISSQVGADAGVNFGRYGQARLGVLGGDLKQTLNTGPESLMPEQSSVRQGAFTARVLLDQLDSVHFPRTGWRAGLKVFNSNTALASADPYTKWDVDGMAVYSYGEHSLSVSAKAGGALGSNRLPGYDQFQWGGFMQMTGYATGQLTGETLQYGRLMYNHRIMRGSIFEGAYGGLTLEAGKVGTPLVPGSPDNLLKSVGVFVAADSPVGPAYLGYGRAADGNSSYYFYLGRPF